MKTDLQKFVELYQSIGVDLEAFVIAEAGTEQYLTIEAYGHPNITGLYGFYTCITFDKNGKFINQEITT